MDATPQNPGGSDPTDEHRFVCPTCSQDIAVNGKMRRAILENGCPVCTAAVTTDAFE